MPNSPILRFAPSPTGRLHLGNCFSALYSFHSARSLGGRFLLRIEDIDRDRFRPEHEVALIADLDWLGITWDRPMRRQSEHMDDYAEALARLDAEELTYPCFCTRKQIAREIAAAPSAPHSTDGVLYPGTCRNLTFDERQVRIEVGDAYAIRLDSAQAIKRLSSDLTWHDRTQGRQPLSMELLGDVVLARKDVPTSYHLAVTVDDALQGITRVTRGVDLFFASHVHRLLQALLDLPTPEYDHHPLINDEQGVRLAKRHGVTSVADLRESGLDPAELRRSFGFAF